MKHARIDGMRIFLRHISMIRTALESYQLAELKYAISAVRGIRKKLTAFERANLNENFSHSKSVFPCKARLPQHEVRDNLQEGEQESHSKGGLLFRENRAKAQRIII